MLLATGHLRRLLTRQTLLQRAVPGTDDRIPETNRRFLLPLLRPLKREMVREGRRRPKPHTTPLTSRNFFQTYCPQVTLSQRARPSILTPGLPGSRLHLLSLSTSEKSFHVSSCCVGSFALSAEDVALFRTSRSRRILGRKPSKEAVWVFTSLQTILGTSYPSPPIKPNVLHDSLSAPSLRSAY